MNLIFRSMEKRRDQRNGYVAHKAAGFASMQI